MLIFSNARIENIPAISAFLNEEIASAQDFSVGWGRKASFVKALNIAQQRNISALCIEDGFIRSMGLGKQGYAPWSLVVDHQGIYFDARSPSDLECLIQHRADSLLHERAVHCIALIRKYKITKYNQKYLSIPLEKFAEGNHVLVVDQTYADQSITCAGADANTFQQMLEQACQDHPNARVWFKLHPDVLHQRAKGHLTAQQLKVLQAQYPNLDVLTEAYNPIELLEHMHEVYVVSSQLGFEALLCGKTVHCFGLPWYAGWDLTDDQHAPVDLLGQRRQTSSVITLEHLFACAYLQYARYISPLTGLRCELEQVINHLIPNLNMQQYLSRVVYLYGFSPWKKTFLKAYLNFPDIKTHFKRYIKPAKNQAVVAWGAKAARLRRLGYEQITTVEDGFIRSIGLGAQLIRPCSLVFDPIGIYYDATRPSQLEYILNDTKLCQQQLKRIQNLHQQILALNISKYNVGNHQLIELSHIQQKKILVVGQVEDDLSIQLGGIDIKTNAGLLKQVRQNHPEAYIIYKPHPDVVAGLRLGAISENEIKQYADRVESDISITQLYACIDELHTITSLSGFEALLRGVKVYCYGMPFYAGWGLTQDRHSSTRRHARLSLDELMYGVLIEYPSYNYPALNASPNLLALCTPEAVIEHISSQKLEAQSGLFAKFKTLYSSITRLKQRL